MRDYIWYGSINENFHLFLFKLLLWLSSIQKAFSFSEWRGGKIWSSHWEGTGSSAADPLIIMGFFHVTASSTWTKPWRGILVLCSCLRDNCREDTVAINPKRMFLIVRPRFIQMQCTVTLIRKYCSWYCNKFTVLYHSLDLRHWISIGRLRDG
jgi:hypothetical protein